MDYDGRQATSAQGTKWNKFQRSIDYVRSAVSRDYVQPINRDVCRVRLQSPDKDSQRLPLIHHPLKHAALRPVIITPAQDSL